MMLVQQALHPESLTVTQQGKSIASIQRSEYVLPFSGLPIVNDDKLSKLMDELDKLSYRAPVNAGLDGWGRIFPGQFGYKLDRRAFAEQFYSFMIEGTSSNLEVPQNKVYPKVDSELLESVKEKPIGQYTTYFNSNNKNRAHNILLAAQAINNQFVFPGESFSFNQVVGNRTEQKGYLRAKIIVRGEISEGIGGGICQTSSTLYNAVDRAGLQIVQRYSHSRRVPYVPPGRDATVSWYGPDFVFQNKYNQPILIRAISQGGQVSVIIYASESINAKKREVPSASKQLPQEVPDDQNVNGISP
ncbi:VanW family protein [Cohnella abietis]|nr:VanW family protein [Cohnella abietis]